MSLTRAAKTWPAEANAPLRLALNVKRVASMYSAVADRWAGLARSANSGKSGAGASGPDAILSRLNYTNACYETERALQPTKTNKQTSTQTN